MLFQSLKDSGDPLVQALLQNYSIWAKKKGRVNELTRSSTLFDTVAIYLGQPGPKNLVTFESLSIAVTDDGFTKIDDKGTAVRCAMAWKDLDAFEEHLTERIIKPA